MAKHKKNVGAIVHRRGVEFRVWAPNAARVDVAVCDSNYGWREYPLQNENDGYWSTMVEHASAGQEYKYVIYNGDQVLRKNDPRALQTITSAGNSVIADSHYDWQGVEYSPPPINKQILYEMHVGTFSRSDLSTIGTFHEAAERLDYLKSLGITTIELMPVNTMLMDHGWGYTPYYLYAVENLYGGRRALLDFVKACHQRNMGVILDVVYNHLGPGNGMDIWQFDGWSENDKGGIYFYNDWRSSTPWGETRLDYGRYEVRQYIEDNVKMWLNDFKLDGLRLDSTLFIRNASGYNNNPPTDIAEGWILLQRINKIARKIRPTALIVGEDAGCNEYITKPIDNGGAGFNAQWQVTMPHAFRQALCAPNNDSIVLTPIIEELQKYYNGNAYERIIYADSHDSAANGAARLNELVQPGNPTSLIARRKQLLAATLLFTAPGIPMIFQGQEFMEAGSFNDWRGLDWDKALRFRGIVDAHAHLISLRKNEHGLTAGLSGNSISIKQVDDQNKVLVYQRWDKGGPKDDVVVIVNFGSNDLPNYNLTWPRDGVWKLRFCTHHSGYIKEIKDCPLSDVTVSDLAGTLQIPPFTAVVYSQDE